MSGWIKLHRATQDSAIASHPEYLAVWVHLLLRAQYSASQCVMGRSVVKLEAGQLVFGRIRFAAQVGISEAKVRAALDVMKSLNMITIKSMAKFSIISITNWQKYQDDNQQIAAEQPALNQQSTSNEPASDHIQESKELKESKEVKNINTLSPVAPPATPKKKSAKTGSRLPDDWRPTQDYVDAAMQINPDYNREWFSATAHKFRDYWPSKNKFQYEGKIMCGDVNAFIAKRQ